MDRRDFLAAGLGGLVAAVAQADDTPKPEIIDTHTHFYDPTRPEGVPWPAKDDKGLYRPVLPAEYEKLARPLGVAGTVVVEASPWVEDNQWLLDLAAKNKFLVGVVGHLDPAADDFDRSVRRFARDPLFRGIRVSHDDLKAGLEGKLVERCKLLVDHDLALDVNGGPGMPSDVARLAAAVPELRVVINHTANQKVDGREPPKAWQEGMQAAAKNPNVFCKASALAELTGREEAPRDADYYRPVLDALWAAFGEDRLVFGSNWPVSARAAPLATVVGITRDYLAGKGEKARGKVLSGNSKAAYKWVRR